MKQTIITNTSLETHKAGEDFAKKITGGDTILLYGDLGAGKTNFVKGLAQGLGITKRIISPTFVVVRTYSMPDEKQFYHIDLYRLENNTDLQNAGIFEVLESGNAIVAIEWAEKLAEHVPQKRWEVHMTPLEDEKREITIEKVEN